MGSCENVNLSVIEEPLCGLVIEENLSLETSVQSGSDQQCCSEVDCGLFEPNVEPVNDEDGCLGSSGVDDTLCVSSGEVTEGTEVLCVIEDGLVGEGENVGDLLLENVLGSECRIGGDFLNEIQSQGDVCNLENGGLCLEKRGSEGEGDCEKPLESSPVTGLQGNFVQMDEMDDKRVSGSSAEGVSNVMVEQIGILAGVETDIHNQISSSQGCEMPSDIILMTGLPDNHPQQNEQEDTKSMGGFSLQVMDGNSDSSAETETVSCNQSSPLEGGEMPLKVLHTGDLVSNGDCHGDQKDEKTASDLSAETVTEILETKSDADTCIQVLASRGSQSDLENLHMAESLSICAKPNEQKDDKSVDGPCVERVANVVDDKSVVMTVVSVEFGTHILPLEENACNSKEGAAKIAHNCNCEKSVSPLLCQSFGIVNCGTSKDTPDQDAIGSINSSSVVECSGHTDNEGKDNVIVGCISETKCPEIASSSSRGSGQRSKSRQKTQKKRTAKKSKNTANVPDSHESIRISLKAERRKRSCLSKPARSSMWGLLGHITQFLEQSNGANQVHNQGLGNARRGRGSGKQKKIRASGSSGGSRGNRCASTSRIRLKVKVGKVAGQCCLTNMVPEVVDMLASANASTSDDRTEMYSGTGLELSKLANSVEDKLREDGTVLQLQCFSKLPEKAETFPDGFVMDGQLATKDSENTKIIDKTSGDADDYLGVTSHVVDEASGGAIDSGCTDPGTSPDSEVINLIPDVQANARHQADLHETVLTSSKDVAARRRRTSSKRGKKDGLPLSRNGIMEDGSPGPVSINEAKPSKKHGHRQDMGNGHCSREILASPTSANASSISSSNKELPMEPSVFSRETEHGLFRKALKEESGVESKTFSNLDVDVELSESQNWVPNKTMGHKLPKSGRVSKGRSKASESASKRGNAHKQREKQRKSVNNCKVKDKDACNQIMCKVETHLESGCQKVDGIGKANTGENTAVTDKSNLDMVLGGLEEQLIPPRKAWVLCDDCHKWRRIEAVLADFIEKTNCRWTCKDSLDKAFAACSIPQEKSNAEINAELDISDASGEEDACDAHLNYKGLERRRSTGYQESTFKCISTNEFLHRKRRSQTIDEIMVCHCESPSKGRLGCGDECLNRILNIECVQGTCPCGDLCSNQQFQKRKYAELEWFRCGKKGYGLKLREDISEGQFLIEYVGEVLDMQSYEARQKEYALKGHRHFYFMTLNGSEVIDACAKGNLGRFINHSCDPNCRTEKWIVNGEICIGLFALRNIKKGEEVTFDYNYVRVFGAAAKKCHCGAPQCRGYIGGDLLNTEVIVQGDSDEEFPEPVMVHEKGVSKVSLKYMRSRANPSDSAEIQTAEGIILKDRHGIDEATVAIGHLENTIEKDDSMNRAAISQLHSSVELEDSKGNLPSFVQPGEMSHQTEDVTSKPMPAVQQETSIEEETMNGTSCYADRLEILSPTMLSISLSHGVDANRNSKSDTVEEKRVSSKSHSLMKVSRSSSSVKKEKVRSNPLNTSKAQVTANKSQMLSIKPKKLLEGSSNGRSEAVEEKLNELLDTDGGISKRKDAPKGYLKLLLLTAASGDSGNGEAIQSNRDLSMILDALLKTKSKAVLIDIINKNGLRMLHNIMKQYRRDFKKIPILRKLLKVLEYLAVRDILTPEHINGGPPCPGME
ncbi:histone-lysine N-methyltransferase ASHH2 isoform X3, partial [Fagus crenata]